MMSENTPSLSDIAAITKNNDGFGSSSWIWVILIFAIFMGGFGGVGNNARVGESYATQADIQRAVDFDTLKQSIGAVNETVMSTGANTIGAVKDMAYNQLGEIRDLQNVVNTGFTNQQNCCCEIKSSILENRYLDAQNTSAIQSAIAQSEYNTSNKIQSVLDKMAENENANLRQQVNQLQMAQALCGVPKISTYAWGTYPYNANVGCGCGNI